MAQSTQVVQTKMLDYFFSLRKLHAVAFQPIVGAGDGRRCTSTSACSGPTCRCSRSRSRRSSRRPSTPDRGVELDVYIVATILERVGRSRPRARAAGRPPRRFAHQPHAVQPARPRVRGARARRPGPGRRPRSAPDHDRVHGAAVRPRRRPAPAPGQGRSGELGFGFAVDDAGRRLRELRADRGAAPDGHQDRPRHHPRHRPRRRQAGPRRGIRVVRAPDRRAAAGRGHRAAGRPGGLHGPRRRPRPGLPARQAGAEPMAPRPMETCGRMRRALPCRRGAADRADADPRPSEPLRRPARVPSGA